MIKRKTNKNKNLSLTYETTGTPVQTQQTSTQHSKETPSLMENPIFTAARNERKPLSKSWKEKVTYPAVPPGWLLLSRL